MNNGFSIFRWFAEPKGPMHLGYRTNREATDLYPRSDTIFAALLATAHLTGRHAAWLPRDANDRCPVLFTSLFPAWRDVLFLPKPFVRLNIADDAATGKALGKVQLVSSSVFGQMLRGEPIAFEPHLRVGERFLLHPDDLPGDLERWKQLKRPPIESVVQTDMLPGNVLDRTTSAADTFRRAAVRVNTSEGCRLWGLVRCPTDLVSEVKSSLGTLGQFGLGGLRSIGFGAFSVTAFEPLASDDPLTALLDPPSNDATHLCLLSLYNPTKDEVDAGVIDETDPHVAYDAVRRGGWIWSAGYTGLRKRTVRMLTEGSIVRRVRPGPLGRIVDVTPKDSRPLPRPHAILRDGRAFAVAFKPTEVDTNE